MFGILTQKRCTKCGKRKDRSEFYKDKNRKDGLFPHCKTCKLSYNKERMESNPERVREISRKSAARALLKPERQAYMQKWRADNVLMINQKILDYVKKHPEQRYKTVHKYIDSNIEKVRANVRQWFEKNPEKSIEYCHNRRARVKGNGGTFTAQEWADLCAKYGNKCIVPGCDRTDLTLDHVIPISRGGSNSIDNIQPLCRHHNFSKNAKVIDYR